MNDKRYLIFPASFLHDSSAHFHVTQYRRRLFPSNILHISSVSNVPGSHRWFDSRGRAASGLRSTPDDTTTERVNGRARSLIGVNGVATAEDAESKQLFTYDITHSFPNTALK